MRFVKVEEVPNRERRHRLKDYWEEFMSMNIRIAKADLDIGEYASPEVARSVMANSIKRFGYPIDLHRRGKDIYLVRRDM